MLENLVSRLQKLFELSSEVEFKLSFLVGNFDALMREIILVYIFGGVLIVFDVLTPHGGSRKSSKRLHDIFKIYLLELNRKKYHLISF